ncbi:flavodoxin [Levilactobacillus sp. N40-8-2]|uniref:flavodoxin n=1 Tax=Levilactobacillus muriae TaxID=3238987 RepID=UPI0038B237DA
MPQIKTAVVYFSVSGRTQTAAETVGRYLQLTPFRLKATDPYPTTGFQQLVARTDAENEQRKLPDFDPVDVSQIETLYLGFPTWYHQPPRIIQNFLTTTQLAGKTVIPFVTSASSRVNESLPFMQKWAEAGDFTIQDSFTANTPDEIATGLKDDFPL